jgi:hypothetical protein
MIFKEVINVQKERQEYILSLKNTNWEKKWTLKKPMFQKFTPNL